jgi:SAM-dependent methyltransferase
MIAISTVRTSHLDNVHLRSLDGSDLSLYPDAVFDRVYSHIVLFHLDKEDMFSYIAEFERVLKPGGIAYFDTWNLAHPFGWQRFLHERELNRRVFPRRANRNRFATPQEIRIYTEGLGLGVVALFEDSSLVQVVAVCPRDGETPETAAGLARNSLDAAHVEKIKPKSVPRRSPPNVQRALFVIDSPVAGARLTGEVDFSGWALHPEEIDDPAWADVAVFCVTLLLQSGGELPREIGYAQHNLPRPDVADAYQQPRYLNSGWHYRFDSRSVPNGDYTLWVEVHLTCGYRHLSVPVQVEN